MAPWHPMNPTWVRSTLGRMAKPLMSSTSTPGATNPLQDTVTRCVMVSGATFALLMKGT